METLTTWSVVEYHKMRNNGILNHRRCELINGEIWNMSPEGEFHRFINDRGAEYLRKVLRNKAKVFEAHPITLTDSEPEPDIAIVKLPDTTYLQHHPYPDDIYWLIEVADSTLTYDLEKKKKLYAKAGIREYWVINVIGKEMTVFRNPQDDDFLSQRTMRAGIIHPVAFPHVEVDVGKLVDIPN